MANKVEMTHSLKVHYPIVGIQFAFSESSCTIRAIGENTDNLRDSQQYVVAKSLNKFIEEYSEDIANMSNTYLAVLDKVIGK